MDFDGTLIGASRRIAPTVMEQLDRVGKMGVVRVLATGRNIDSLLSMMPADTPLDYLVTGSGTLTLRWPSRSVFQQNCIPSALCHGIAEMLRSQGISFFLLEAPPQCEYCYGFRGEGPTCCEFDRRLRGYKSKTRSYDDLCCGAASRWQALSSDFSQFIIFSDSVEMYRTLSHNIRQVEKAMMKEGTAAKALRIVRTTSPFDHKSMWVEVLPVTKAEAIEAIAREHGISREQCVGVGNDFNDEDLLQWCGKSFVVRNAPKELQSKYATLSRTAEEGGVAEALVKCFPLNQSHI